MVNKILLDKNYRILFVPLDKELKNFYIIGAFGRSLGSLSKTKNQLSLKEFLSRDRKKSVL